MRRTKGSGIFDKKPGRGFECWILLCKTIPQNQQSGTYMIPEAFSYNAFSN